MSGGHKGLVLGSRPRQYRELPQQKRMREAAKFCNIRKGMSRAELVTAMKKCIPEYFSKKKADDGNKTLESLQIKLGE